jgi:phosphate starvation-inducible PhoH-like protein
MVNIAHGLKPKNRYQEQFLRSLRTNTISIGVGEAGTGKTLIAMYSALLALNNPDDPINSVLYVRPFVRDKDEVDIGAMPGDYGEKVDSLGTPLWTNLSEIVHPKDFQKLRSTMEISHIGNIKGASLSNTFIIFDEAEDATERLFKAVVTRIAHGSRMCIIGDPTQCSLKTEAYLPIAANRLKDVEGVGVTFFPKGTSVRHPILAKILEALG